MKSIFFQIIFLSLLMTVQTRAHIVEQIFLALDQIGKEWEINVTFDAAYSLPEMRNDLDAPQPKRQWLLDRTDEEHKELLRRAEDYLRESINITCAGKEVSYMVSFPDYESSPPDFPHLLNGGAYFTVRLTGKIQQEASGAFKLSVNRGVKPDFVVAVKASQQTHYLVIPPNGEETLYTIEPQGALEIPNRGIWSVFWIGYEHVLPDGLDHVLFIMALFLLARKWKPLLLQSLAFTIAHSVSLGLAASGILPVYQWPGAWLIEPFIAISIAVVALENVFFPNTGKRRLAIVFVFGLIHGLGFAGSLGTALHRDGDWLLTLAVANLGVEFAQVSILLVAWCATMVWWQSPYYQKVRIGASVLIALIGSFWAFERLLT